jgi:hypothetical protein
MSDVYSNLRSIGIFFTSESPDFSKKIITPEDVLIGSLSALKADKLTFSLVYTWIRRNPEWIHVESLLKKAEAEKNPVHLAFLAALLASSENRNLINAASKIKYPKKNLNEHVDKTLRLAADFGQIEFDPVFSKYGLKISKPSEEGEKKFIPRKYVLQSNPFLFCRTLFGTNWRADVAALLMLRPESTPTEIMRSIGCSYETAHRNHQSLMAAAWPRVDDQLKHFGPTHSSQQLP